jgi:hypothetical protein
MTVGGQYPRGYANGQYTNSQGYGQFGQIFNQQRRGYNLNQGQYNQGHYNQGRKLNYHPRRRLQMGRQGGGGFAGNYNNYIGGQYPNQRNANYGNNINPFLQNRNYNRAQGVGIPNNFAGMNQMSMVGNSNVMGRNAMPMGMQNSMQNPMQTPLNYNGNGSGNYNSNAGNYNSNGNSNSNSSPLAAIGVLIGMDAGVARAFFMRVWAQAKVLGLKPAEVKITAFVYAKFVETFPDLVAGWVRNGEKMREANLFCFYGSTYYVDLQ